MGFKVSATTAMGEKVTSTHPLPPAHIHTPFKIFVLEINRLDRIVSGFPREHFEMENGEGFQMLQAPGVGWGGVWGRASMNTLAPFSSAMSHILM